MSRVLLALVVMPCALLGAQGVAYEGGASLASGKYVFTTTTTTWTLASGLAWTAGPVTLRASMPLILQNSTLVAGSGAGMMPSGGGGGGRSGGMGGMGGGSSSLSWRAAPGDPVVQAGVTLGGGSRLLMTVRGMAKIPVTDTTQFGTGEWDVGAGAGVTWHAGGASFVGLDVNWWRMGDLPALDFRDPVFGSLTVGRLFSSAWGGGVFVSGGTSAIPGDEGPLSVGLSLTRFGTPAMWGITAAVGLTETVPAFSMGVSWRVAL